jgi:MFS family permease
VPTTSQEKLWSRDYVLFLGSTVLLWTSFYFPLLALPIYVMQHLHGSQTQAGLLSGMLTISAVLSRPLAGYAVDRWGRRWIQLASLLLFCGVVFSYNLAQTLLTLFAIRLLHGIPFGAATTASSAVAADLVPAARRGEGIGYFALAQTVATAFGPALALSVLGDGQFTRLFVTAGLIAVGALALASMVRYPPIRNPAARFSLRSALERRVGWLSVTSIFISLGYGSIISFVTLYAAELGIARAGLFFSAFAAGVVLTRLVAGRIFDRHGPKPVISASLGVLAAGYVILALVHTEMGFLAAAFVLGLGFGAVTPSLQTMAVNSVPAARRGAANGTLFSAFDIGIGLGSSLLGAVAQSAGSYATMYWLAGLILIIPALLFFLVVMPRYDVLRET